MLHMSVSKRYEAQVLADILHSDPFRDAVMGSCEHTACRACLTEWLQERPGCPECRGCLMLGALRANRLASTLADELQVKCPFNSPEGCAWTGKRELWATHAKDCEKGVGRFREIQLARRTSSEQTRHNHQIPPNNSFGVLHPPVPPMFTSQGAAHPVTPGTSPVGLAAAARSQALNEQRHQMPELRRSLWPPLPLSPFSFEPLSPPAQSLPPLPLANFAPFMPFAPFVPFASSAPPVPPQPVPRPPGYYRSLPTDLRQDISRLRQSQTANIARDAAYVHGGALGVQSHSQPVTAILEDITRTTGLRFARRSDVPDSAEQDSVLSATERGGILRWSSSPNDTRTVENPTLATPATSPSLDTQQSAAPDFASTEAFRPAHSRRGGRLSFAERLRLLAQAS